MLGASMSVGAIIGSALTGYLLNFFTWSRVFLLLAVPGFLWAAGFFPWFRERPEEHSWANDEERRLIHAGDEKLEQGSAKAATPWLIMLTSVPMMLICLQQFFRAGAYVFYQTWYPTFLQQARAVSREQSGYLTSLALFGIVLGTTLGGVLSDWIMVRTGSRVWSRKGLSAVSSFCAALLLCLAYFTEEALVTGLTVSLASFFAGLGSPTAYAITLDMGGRHVSTVFSTMNMCGNLGGTLCPLVVASLAGNENKNWNVVLLLLVGVYFAAAVCWLLLDPRGSIFPEEASKDK
jgi:MFS family permease